MKATRGIRNNNPANIRRGSAWRGLVEKSLVPSVLGTPYDAEFCQFLHVQFGIRALIITLRTYVRTHGLHEIHDIICRFAPPSDGNATNRYIEYVMDELLKGGVRQRLWYEDFDRGYVSEPLYRVCAAICWMESNYTLTKTQFVESLKIV